jgi:hypothetical protein
VRSGGGAAVGGKGSGPKVQGASATTAKRKQWSEKTSESAPKIAPQGQVADGGDRTPRVVEGSGFTVETELSTGRRGDAADPGEAARADGHLRTVTALANNMATRPPRSELLFPSEVGGYRSNSALTKPFKGIAEAMRLKKQISPKAMRRSFQDAMREAQVANVVVRSISGHLTERMQQRYSTAQGHEQEQAIARIVNLTRVKRHIAASNGCADGQQEGQHRGTA